MLSSNLIATGAGPRLLIAAALIALLWLTVLWAVG
jgi:hypothetical protein